VTPPATPGSDFVLNRRVFVALVVAAIGLGVAVRATHVVSSDFPLNDGGLFYAMARDIQDADYALPAATSYNGEGIPFTYPPLGFYAAAILDDFTPLALMDAFRFLPLLATCLTVPAFYLLAQSMLRSRVAVVVAVFAFALMPRSFVWLLMGGGVTRSLGLLFAILALYFVRTMYTRRDASLALPAALLCAATILSHLETGWFLAFSAALFFLAYGRDRVGVRYSAVVVAATCLLVSPWLISVLAEHGTRPLLAAQETGGSIFSDGETREATLLAVAHFFSTSEPYLPLLGILGLLGTLVCLASNRYLLPAWWLAIVLLDLRAFPTFTTVPLAMLTGVGFAEVLLPALMRYAQPADPEAEKGFVGRVPGPALVVGGLALFVVAGAFLNTPGKGGEVSLLVSLSEDQRQSMEVVSQNSPPDSRFLVVPDSGWEVAKVAEWFPVLAQRPSITTVQGTEWVPGGAFESRVRAYYMAFECGYRTADCLDEWTTATGGFFTHVYISKPPSGQCCSTLTSSLRQDHRYSVVYDGPGATIFARLWDMPLVEVSGEPPGRP
jgi:hypothetical protein